MDALQYLHTLEARLESQSYDGRLDKVIKKLSWVADQFAAMRNEDDPVYVADQKARLFKVAYLMDEVSDCMDDYLATEAAPEE